MVTQWLIVLAAMALVGLALDAMRQRERALRLARQLCESRGLQLLDETVGLAGVRLRRGDDSVLHLQRRYSFEVSLDGNDRHAGHVWTVAGYLLASSLPPSAEQRANGPSDGGPVDASSNLVELDAHRRRRRLH